MTRGIINSFAKVLLRTAVLFLFTRLSLSASCLRAVPYQPQPASQPLCFSARHPPTLCFAAPGKPCLVLKTRRNIFPPLPSPLPQGERKNIYSLSRFTQIPGAYRSEHKRGRKSVSLIFSERARQRAEISPRSARQCAKRLSHQILRAVWQGGYSHHVIGFLKSFARKRAENRAPEYRVARKIFKKRKFLPNCRGSGRKKKGRSYFFAPTFVWQFVHM